MNSITLLSDFGLQDASIAAAKGILLQHLPSANFIDISHMLEPFHVQQAAYILLSAYRNFPKGTSHIVLFDIFSEKSPRLVLCAYGGHYFLAPDNGVLPLAFGPEVSDVWQCYELTSPGIFSDWLHEVGKVILKLQSQSLPDLDLNRCALKNAAQHWQPVMDGNTVECHVIYIDRYENVVINITRTQFEEFGKGRAFRIQFMRDEELAHISTHFNNVAEGQKLCRFNATGFLEIAINRGKAASLFGFKVYRERHFIYNTIKIFFA